MIRFPKEGVHSGGASGYVPSSFRVARQLLSRIENQETEKFSLEELKVKTPERKLEETAGIMRKIVGDDLKEEFPWVSKWNRPQMIK